MAESTKELFRKVWGHFPTGVSVITFWEDDTHHAVHGITANSVCSVSLEPFLVLVCVDHKSRSFPILSKGKRFVMNFLAQHQSDASRFFAKSDSKENPPFEFGVSRLGQPTLKGACAAMDCEIVAKHLAGDHTIFVGKVEDIQDHGGEPLVFHRGKYVEVLPPKV
ncbi:MAG: flavin reductase family protein [Chloroflexi bacterium]|nr:flavin reductase family protein [Chloroflexota bacterium]